MGSEHQLEGHLHDPGILRSLYLSEVGVSDGDGCVQPDAVGQIEGFTSGFQSVFAHTEQARYCYVDSKEARARDVGAAGVSKLARSGSSERRGIDPATGIAGFAEDIRQQLVGALVGSVDSA